MANDNEAQQDIARFKKLDGDRQNNKNVWQDISGYILPRKADIKFKRSRGQEKIRKQFDSTAPNAHELLASFLSGTLTSTSIPWFGIKAKDPQVAAIDEVNNWTDAVSRRMLEAFNESNHRLQAHEEFLDLTSFGTALTIQESLDDSKPFEELVFKNYFIQDFVIAENSKSLVDTVIRRFKFTARQARQEWGKERLTKSIKEALQENNFEKQFLFYHVIKPKADTGKKISSELEYTNFIICDKDKEYIQDDKGYHEWPCTVPRWAHTSDDVWGYGIGHKVLPDVRVVNKVIELILARWPKDIDPPLLTPEGMPKLDLRAGKQNSVPRAMIEAVKPLLSNKDAQSNQISLENRVDQIEKAFFTNQLQMQKQAQMTATESTIIFELMERMMGPVLGRNEVEIFTPRSNRAFGIMNRGGAFRDIPLSEEALKSIVGNIKVEFIGPLARSQKLKDAQATSQWIRESVEASTTTGKVEILDYINWDEWVQENGRGKGVPESLIVDDADVEEIREERAQRIAEAQEKEDAKDLVDAAGKLGKIGGGDAEGQVA